MAAPTGTAIGSGSSKSTLNGNLSVTISPTSVSAGDYIVVGYTTDPGAAAVTFGNTGTATLSSWTTLENVSNGSGTTGIKAVLAYTKVTASGTLVTVTCNLASGTNPRSADVIKVSGADGTTPIALHGNAAGTSLNSGGNNLLGIAFTAWEAAGGVTITGAASWPGSSQTSTGWSSGTEAHSATTAGTTGSSGATNVSIAHSYEQAPSVGAGTVGPTLTGLGPSGTAQDVWVLFQDAVAPAGPVGIGWGIVLN